MVMIEGFENGFNNKELAARARARRAVS